MINHTTKNLFNRYLLCLIAACGVIGCSYERSIPSDMHFASLPSEQQQPYLILPGDKLEIKFFHNPEMNEKLPVRSDGKISLQLVGDINTTGLTPSELAAEITKRYSKELIDPAVTVIVRDFSGHQVFVDGEVERPGMVSLMPNLTVWDSIIKSGGFKQTASRGSVIVIRKGVSNQIIPYRLDLKSTSLDQLDSDFKLRPLDVVYVPKTWIAETDTAVEQYVEKLLLFKGWYINLNPFAPVGF